LEISFVRFPKNRKKNLKIRIVKAVRRRVQREELKKRSAEGERPKGKSLEHGLQAAAASLKFQG